jgi:hypothetical protein
MRFMTKKQEERFGQLVELAGGNLTLVEEALRRAAPGRTPKLEELVNYIQQHSKYSEKKVAQG